MNAVGKRTNISDGAYSLTGNIGDSVFKKREYKFSGLLDSRRRFKHSGYVQILGEQTKKRMKSKIIRQACKNHTGGLLNA